LASVLAGTNKQVLLILQERVELLQLMTVRRVVEYYWP